MLNRRQFLGRTAAAGSALALGGPARLHAQTAAEPHFLIVLGASGGASLIDSFMAIRASESEAADRINTYPDDAIQDIAGTPFRAIDAEGTSLGAIPAAWRSEQSRFVKKHKQDMMVATMTGTSVNHAVAQRRAITGNEAWAGRTIQELNAWRYGEGALLPNVAMATGTSFIDRGNDASLPASAFAETVAVPAVWPLSLHGAKGLPRAPRPDSIALARDIRARLDQRSKFARIFERSPRLSRYLEKRRRAEALEAASLIDQLLLFPDSDAFPLERHGLSPSADAARVREVFPNYAQDPLQAQAALAFLLIKHRISVSVTIGASFNAELADGASLDGGGIDEGDLINPPIAFDFSHQAHRPTQALMWDRMLGVADGLIGLLKGEALADGQSFWDRTLIYVATDFGRDKIRPAGATDFGTSHHLNNGILAISPMVAGNRVLGGVDPNTGLTYGFNPQTGEPDPGRNMTETEIFAGLLGALGIDPGEANIPSVPAMHA